MPQFEEVRDAPVLPDQPSLAYFSAISEQARPAAEGPFQDQERQEDEGEPGAGFDQGGFSDDGLAGREGGEALGASPARRATEFRSRNALGSSPAQHPLQRHLFFRGKSEAVNQAANQPAE